MGRTSWEGGSGDLDAHSLLAPSVPPLSRKFENLECQNAESVGGTLRVKVESRPNHRCPPSQLLRPTEAPISSACAFPCLFT